MSATYRTDRGHRVSEVELERRSALITKEHQRKVRRERHNTKQALKSGGWDR